MFSLSQLACEPPPGSSPGDYRLPALRSQGTEGSGVSGFPLPHAAWPGPGWGRGGRGASGGFTHRRGTGAEERSPVPAPIPAARTHAPAPCRSRGAAPRSRRGGRGAGPGRDSPALRTLRAVKAAFCSARSCGAAREQWYLMKGKQPVRRTW